MKSISVLIVTLLIVIGTNSAYNKQWSYTLNRLSRITHQTKDQIQTWNCKLCRQGQKLTNTAYIQNNITDVVGYAGYLPSKNNILVLMRGTVDVKNWIEDFSFYLVNYQQCKGCLIHEGFYLDYLSVSTQVISIVKGMIDKYPTARIVVIGSSLGAALATVAAIQLQLHFGNVDEIHNFGSPRVGNANFAQFLRIKIKQIYRVIHNRDIVPHVPFQSQNFHHAPFEILYDQNMENYKICDESGEDPTCSNSYNPNFSIPDHTSYWF